VRHFVHDFEECMPAAGKTIRPCRVVRTIIMLRWCGFDHAYAAAAGDSKV